MEKKRGGSISRREKAIQVSPEQEGLRLDIFLSQYVSSRSQAEKIIKQGGVKNISAGPYESVKPSHKVKAGESYRFVLEDKGQQAALKPYDYDVPILYEDAHILVINKPAGIVMHPGAGHEQDTLVNALFEKVSLSSGVDPLRPGLVHRLDKGVSGLLLLSKTQRAQSFLIEQFKLRKVRRIYRALVLGLVKKPAGQIVSFIGRHPKERKKFYSFDKEVAGAKKALTYYRVLESFQEGIHHIQCRLETGRTHQIRVHLSSKGWPILGDEVYGSCRRQSRALDRIGQEFSFSKLLFPFGEKKRRSENAKPLALDRIGQECTPSRIALYSAFLEFIHPVGQKLLTFSLPWPEDFQPFMKKLGFSTKGPGSSFPPE
ncbi:MAG: RluA family pseudouridine synthase, partial [Oligoflexia bacterium]|nr:RluA family pseudouridine synthase [Oligoflexia bacterium]